MRRLLLLLPVLIVTGPVGADPLDRVTGTEDWHRAGPEDLEAEWNDWYRARVAWRRGTREIRVQRVISQRLARLLLKIDDPSEEEIRRIVQAGVKPVAEEAPARETPPRRRRGRRPARPAPPPLQSEVEEGQTAEAPEYSNVPVERLDATGQALDEEGDRELQRTYQKKKRPPARKTQP